MTEPKAETVQLPEPCRAGLMTLWAEAERAKTEADRVKRTFDLALNAALSALSIDVTKPSHTDLDTGVVTLAE